MPASFTEPEEEFQFDFRRTNFAALGRSLAMVDWAPLYSANSINEAVDYLIVTLNGLFSLHVPATRPKRNPPWANKRLRALKRDCAKALRHYSHHRNPYTKRVFVSASNSYRIYNQLLYTLYVQRTQKSLKQNPKRFWSFVNGKRKERGLPSIMSHGTNTASSADGICHLFANHFSSVFKTEPVASRIIDDALRNVPQGILDMRDICFSETDVAAAIKKLKPSLQPGPDGIPPIIFKNCVDTLCAPLTAICNLSLSQSSFPDAWKESFLFPVFKKGDRTAVENYRGITSLCAGSKLLESLVNKLLFQEVKRHISCDQHGFFPGRSTTTNLTEFTSFCIQNMENGTQIDTIYTDLKAAFDRVDHDLLLAKVKRMGAVPTFVDWLRSYLVNRRLSVRLGSARSNQFSNRSGVPQDLGVHLDEKLSFREHYSYIIAKANKNLGFIFRVTKEFRDPYCLRALYYSLVRSVIEYAAVVWSPYSGIWSSRLEAIQRRFVRYALKYLPWRNTYDLPPYLVVQIGSHPA
ncbi:uncharacterized protein LOC128740165 [Sabethes cyaneus]|uniref:uncharacterized protein LOC128740165 n=1 Tax=Sabethes cyaneus TaxID=53552 RepID=UPI00237E2B7F|nr:uncharacterized protein LOC128740165 [Sabethes cyaneus]